MYVYTSRCSTLLTLLDLCVLSLRRGHANIVCIVPILTDDPRRESETGSVSSYAGLLARFALMCSLPFRQAPFRMIIVVGPDGMPCVVLWRPEALDCRAPIPPEAPFCLMRLRAQYHYIITICMYVYIYIYIYIPST